MSFHPLAVELNEALEEQAQTLFSMLSNYGQKLLFPKDIPFQSQQAKDTDYNATIGIATEAQQPMHLPIVDSLFSDKRPAKEEYP